MEPGSSGNFDAFSGKLGITADKANLIMRSFILSKSLYKLDYGHKTVIEATENSRSFKTPFKDVLISGGMKENNILGMVTENARDFSRVPVIIVINPFKS